MISIYALFDPRVPEHIRYIGKAKDMAHRYHGHIGKAVRGESKSHCGNWIRKLLADGVRPTMTQIASVEEVCWPDEERRLIEHYREAGHDLTNVCKGGEGSSMELETRAKLSAALKGRVCSQVTRDKIAAASIGRHHSTEARKRMAIAARALLTRPQWTDKGKAVGERHGKAKLTLAQVLSIRASDETSAMIAEAYGISRVHAANIKSGKKWAFVA